MCTAATVGGNSATVERDTSCLEHRYMVLKLITKRGARLIGGTDTVGRGRIGTEQGGGRVAHRGQRQANEVDQLSTRSVELPGSRFPHRLTPPVAAGTLSHVR